MMIFLIIICTFSMFLAAPFSQLRLYEVNPEYFKKVKIKKLSFLFRGMGGKNYIYGRAKDYGVIIPMFAIQIMGYILAIVSWILVPIFYLAVGLDITTIAIITVGILVSELLIIVLVTSVCIIISRSKDKKNNR